MAGLLVGAKTLNLNEKGAKFVVIKEDTFIVSGLCVTGGCNITATVDVPGGTVLELFPEHLFSFHRAQPFSMVVRSHMTAL